jgi:hypothetical protein
MHLNAEADAALQTSTTSILSPRSAHARTKTSKTTNRLPEVPSQQQLSNRHIEIDDTTTDCLEHDDFDDPHPLSLPKFPDVHSCMW